MADIIGLIEQLLTEHQQILKSIDTVEQITGDLDVALELEEVKEAVMPGRLGQKSRGLSELEKKLSALKIKLEEHFMREEVGLMNALEQQGEQMLTSAWNTILLEHPLLRSRLDSLVHEVVELDLERSSQEVWEGKIWGLRAYIAHTKKLLEVHAQSEFSLLKKTRRKIAGK